MSGRNNVGTLDLAIIGAGPAGLAAAARARLLGVKEVVVFDRNERPGGSCRSASTPASACCATGRSPPGWSTPGAPSGRRRRRGRRSS